MLDWMDYTILDNPVTTWAISAAVFGISWLIINVVRRLVLGRLHALSENKGSLALEITENVLGRTKAWFKLIVALFIASRFITWSANLDSIIIRVAIIGVLLQAGVWASAGISSYVKLGRSRHLEEDPGTVAAMDVLGFVMRVTVWTIVLLLVLDNLGVNITALVAGLGVGGIAVALAAQNMLSDLFASLSIVLDKPFVVGDFLIIDDMIGSVEQVGLKTTRIRSLSGEQLILSNNDLLSSRIRNYGRMFERRVAFHVGVVYQTPADKLRRIPDMVRAIIEAEDETRFDRAHFQRYGDFALVFEIVYFVTQNDYVRYMDIQQSINLQIFEAFAAEGIEFAYPTQTLFVNANALPAS